jgi:hypothetical protein
MMIDPNTGLSDAEALSFNSVRIEVKYNDGEDGLGTGFLFQFQGSKGGLVPSLLTNRHLMESADIIKLSFNPTGINDKVDLVNKNDQIDVFITNLQIKGWYGHPNSQIDLAMIPLTKHILDMRKNLPKMPYMMFLNKANFVKPDEWDTLTALEPVIIVGYPSGIWDSYNIMPIFRRGITATHPKHLYMGNPEFLVDAAVYRGSSGSPVFLYDPQPIMLGQDLNKGKHRPRLAGILSKVFHHPEKGKYRSIPIPARIKKEPYVEIPNNLGVVIRCTELDGFISLIDEALDKSKNDKN